MITLLTVILIAVIVLSAIGALAMLGKMLAVKPAKTVTVYASNSDMRYARYHKSSPNHLGEN